MKRERTPAEQKAIDKINQVFTGRTPPTPRPVYICQGCGDRYAQEFGLIGGLCYLCRNREIKE